VINYSCFVLESQPDHIPNIFDDLEDAPQPGSVFARLSPDEAGWLAQFIREKVEKDRERAGDDIELELKVVF
jgi:breast cancer 2 susceptibility protein